VITAPDPTPEQLTKFAAGMRRVAWWYLSLGTLFAALGVAYILRRHDVFGTYWNLGMAVCWYFIALVQWRRARKYAAGRW
jgi:hypothetical protein